MEKKKIFERGGMSAWLETPQKGDAAAPRIRFRSVSGNWSASVGYETGTAFQMVHEICEKGDEGMKSFLEAWISMVYRVTVIVPDLEFMKDFIGIYQAMMERYRELYGETHTDAEDAEAVESVRRMAEAGEMLSEQLNDAGKADDA